MSYRYHFVTKYYEQKPSRGGFDALRVEAEPSLTFDMDLQPALEVSLSARNKADAIFAREQDDILEAANAVKAKVKPALYVDENGYVFLLLHYNGNTDARVLGS